MKKSTMQSLSKPFNSPMLIASAASISPASGDVLTAEGPGPYGAFNFRVTDRASNQKRRVAHKTETNLNDVRSNLKFERAIDN